MNELISVIIPAYNVEPYLEKCLDSVLKQDYKCMEILIIDDGSEDGTLSIAKKYSRTDERIQVYHTTNKGVSAARNYGLELAKGEYCSFVDGDDWLEPNALSGMLTQLQSTRTDLLNCQYHRVTPTGDCLEEYNFCRGVFTVEKQEEKMQFYMQKLIPYYVGYEVWNKLYKMKIIREHHLRFSTDMYIGEDLLFQMNYILYSDKIVCVAERYYNYCIRENSAMGTADNIEKNMEQHITLTGEFRHSMVKRYKDKADISATDLICGQYMCKVLDNVSILKIAEMEEEVQNYTLLCEQLNRLIQGKKALRYWYGAEVGKLYWRKYLYYHCAATQGVLWEKCYLLIYEFYRKLRKRPLIVKK
ncbi:MAG: glycosyltransferase family 2 protein [Lachnospiraceae bacterium]|nr:glycosyltransferase family 2 protein [Lachnospiraceae bacterium]